MYACFEVVERLRSSYAKSRHCINYATIHSAPVRRASFFKFFFAREEVLAAAFVGCRDRDIICFTTPLA